MAASPVCNASNEQLAASQQEHVPAWKRLGLKLKNAKDTEKVVSSDNGVSQHGCKRSSSDIHFAARVKGSPGEPLAKRRRVDSRTNEPNQSNGSLAKTSATCSTDRGARLKKKVSFTAETKLEDGRNELITNWEQDDYAYYEQKAADNDAREALRVAPESDNKSQSLASRLEKRSTTPRKTKGALDYLNVYHKSRSSWKFNKNREVWLLRHILSTDDIPPSFNIALASYVHGLGSRQARSRLLDQCRRAIEEGQEGSSGKEHGSDPGPMEDPSRRKAYHDDAIRRFRRSFEDHLDDEQRKADEDDPEYQRWLSRRRRAELLLWAVTPSNSTADKISISRNEVNSDPHSSASAKSVTRAFPKEHISKIKNRTAVVELSTSSEDETRSSDDEDDDSELANDQRVSNGLVDSSSSTDESSSATSSTESDSISETESSTVADHSRRSFSSSKDGSGAEADIVAGKRQQSAISISDGSTFPVSTTPDETSSSTSTNDGDERDESDSRSSTATVDSQ